MLTIPLERCTGLDTRPSWKGDDQFTLAESTNLQILPGGSISSRPARIAVATLSADSVGLYSRGGLLHALVPSGQSLQSTAPTGFIYDGIGRGGSYDYSDIIGRIVGTETFGTSQVYGPHGYVAFIRADNGVVEHHWIKEPPASAASFTSTYVALPFQPGKALTKIKSKIVAPDPSNGYFRFCSSLDPTDWTAENDAGFRAALQFVSGSREITALGIHRSLLAVYYSDAVQLWFMDEIPENIYLSEVLDGPGTEHPDSVVNIYGDGYFLSRGCFSTLATATTSGQADYDDVGDRIRTLTANVTVDDVAVGLWSQKRGQYLIAVGSTIYCLGVYPREKASVWTTWTMPEDVDYITENEGVVYYRSGNDVFRLDDTVGQDSGEDTDLAWSGLTRQMGGKNAKGKVKALARITPQCTAAATWTPVLDGRELTAAHVRIPGSLSPIPAHFTGSGRRIAIRFAGTGLMRIDGVELEAQVCGV